MADIVVIFIIAGMVVLAIRFLWRSRKNGANCIGCPYSGSCTKGDCEKKKEN